MKNTILLFVLILSVLASMAQNVGINSDGTAPATSAMLDVKSSTKGFLVPRMSATERGNISSPATGLLVYQTDGTAGFYYYTGLAWTLVGTGSGNGTLTDVTGTAPVVSSGGTTPAISITAASTGAAGSMSAADKIKLDGIATAATNYTHPTGDGNLHVIATSTTNSGKVLTAGASAGSLSWTTPASGTVTSVTATSPIASTGGAAPVISLGTVPVANGGTGATTLTGYIMGTGTTAMTASATIPAANISGNISGNAANVTGTVAVANGGTGTTSATVQGGVIYGSSTTVMASTVAGTSGQVLTSNGTSAPTWSTSIGGNAATATSATNLTGGSAGTIAYQTAAGATSQLTAGTSGYLLTSNGAAAPSWLSTLPVANGGTGTTTGSITGTTALTFAAGGTNQNVTLTPSGTGYTLLNGNVGIGTTTPSVKLDARATSGDGALGIGTSSATASTTGAGALRYSTSSGGILEYSNGTAWNTLTSTVTKSTVIASKSSAQTIIHNTSATVVGWTEIVDNNNTFNPSTGVFTAPRTGNYVFNFSYAFTASNYSSTPSVIEAWMQCSDGNKLRKQLLAAPISATNQRCGALISFVVNLISGQTLSAAIWHDTGADRSLEINGGGAGFVNISIVEL